MLTIKKNTKLNDKDVNNKNMRYPILSVYKSEKGKEHILSQLSKVPSCDIPYWVEYNSVPDKKKWLFNWEYGGNNEPQKKFVDSPTIRLRYGKNSGCLYSAEVDIEKIDSLIERLKKSATACSRSVKFAERFQNNFLCGLSILFEICLQIRNNL